MKNHINYGVYLELNYAFYNEYSSKLRGIRKESVTVYLALTQTLEM
jgi:hypothetical protein